METTENEVLVLILETIKVNLKKATIPVESVECIETLSRAYQRIKSTQF